MVDGLQRGMASHFFALMLLPVAVGVTPWAERLAQRAGHAVPPSHGGAAELNRTLVTAEAVAGLRALVQHQVEPAITALQSREASLSSTEECFSSAAGSFLRFRCCVYYSALAAAIIEARYGVESDPRATSRLEGDVLTAPPPRALAPYGALARWLLTPAASAGPDAHTLAGEFIATAEADEGGSYDLSALRGAASRLPAPLGRYAARVRVHGILGTLWRCEVISAMHTVLDQTAPASPSPSPSPSAPAPASASASASAFLRCPLCTRTSCWSPTTVDSTTS